VKGWTICELVVELNRRMNAEGDALGCIVTPYSNEQLANRNAISHPKSLTLRFATLTFAVQPRGLGGATHAHFDPLAQCLQFAFRPPELFLLAPRRRRGGGAAVLGKSLVHAREQPRARGSVATATQTPPRQYRERRVSV
jgi:hypothetical protein